MFHIVWEFLVTEEHRTEFERAYSKEGVWGELFRSDTRYNGTTLLRDSTTPGRYFTIDRWETPEAFTEFRLRNASQYDAADQACARLTSGERLVGNFEEV